MSSYFVHGNASIFKNPKQFDPDRWLEPEGKDLDKWLVAFSKGPRSCLGLKYVKGSVMVLVVADN